MSKFKTILILGLAMVLISIPAFAGKPYKNFWLQVQDEYGAMRTDFVSISVYDLNTTDLATIYTSEQGTSKTNAILLAATSSGTAVWYGNASTYDILVTFSDQTVAFDDFSVYDHRIMCLDKAKTITENFNKVTIASTEEVTLALTPGQVAGYGINMTTASQTLTGSFYGLQMHLVGLVHGSQRVTGIRMNMPVSTGLYDAVFQVTGRQTKGEIIDIVTVQTLGEVLDVSFDTVTLAGAMTGINLDMSTNVTHNSQTIVGLNVAVPSGSTSTGILIGANVATGIDCNSTTASSSTTTGSIHTDGGLGVAGKVFTGDHIYMTAGKHIYFRGSGDDYQSIWSISGGKLKIQTSGVGADDLIIDGTITQMDDITLQSGALIISDDTTEASATTDGAIQTDGGVGIAKKLFVGGTSNFAGLLTAAGGIDTVGATNDITLKNDATIVNTSADLLTITETEITLAGTILAYGNTTVAAGASFTCDNVTARISQGITGLTVSDSPTFTNINTTIIQGVTGLTVSDYPTFAHITVGYAVLDGTADNLINLSTATANTADIIFANGAQLQNVSANKMALINTDSELLINGRGVNFNYAVGGTGDAITLDYTPNMSGYSTGMRVSFQAIAANTGATTIDIDGLGAVNIYEAADLSALDGNDIRDGMIVELVFDGTEFQQVSQSGN